MDNKIQYILSWSEYGELIDDLWKNLDKGLKEHKITIDAIIIVMREGVFTGVPLSYRLNTYKVIPIQYKYMLYNGGNELKQITEIPKLKYELPSNTVFLLTDTFPAGGKTMDLTIGEFKKLYPTAKFVFASIIEDKTKATHPDILFSVHAVDVNKQWETAHPVYAKAGVKNILYTALPWENIEEELAGANATEWSYR